MVFGRYAATIVPLNDLGIRLVGRRGDRRALGDQLRRRPAGQLGADGADDCEDRRHRRPADPAVRDGHAAHAGAARARSRRAASCARSSRGSSRSAAGTWSPTRRRRRTRPERVIPRALMLGTAVVVVIYLALNSAYLLVLPFDAVLTSTHIAFDATAGDGRPHAPRRRSPSSSSSRRSARSAASSSPVRACTTRWPRTGCCSSGWARSIRVHKTPYLAIVVQGDLVVGARADRHLRRHRVARRLHRVDLLRRARARHHRAAAARAATRRRSARGAFRSCPSCSRSSVSRLSSTRSPPIRARA